MNSTPREHLSQLYTQRQRSTTHRDSRWLTRGGDENQQSHVTRLDGLPADVHTKRESPCNKKVERRRRLHVQVLTETMRYHIRRAEVCFQCKRSMDCSEITTKNEHLFFVPHHQVSDHTLNTLKNRFTPKVSFTIIGISKDGQLATNKELQ